MPKYNTKSLINFPTARIKTLEDLLSHIFWREAEGIRKKQAIKLLRLLNENPTGLSKMEIDKQINTTKKERTYMYETLYTLKTLELIRKEGKYYVLSRGFYNKLQYIMDTLKDEKLIPVT